MFGLDNLVDIHESDIQFARQAFSDGRFSGGHKADQREMVSHRLLTLRPMRTRAPFCYRQTEAGMDAACGNPESTPHYVEVAMTRVPDLNRTVLCAFLLIASMGSAQAQTMRVSTLPIPGTPAFIKTAKDVLARLWGEGGAAKAIV